MKYKKHLFHHVRLITTADCNNIDATCDEIEVRFSLHSLRCVFKK